MKVEGNVRHLARGDYEFGKLDQSEGTIVEYIWIGGSGLDIRSKARVLEIGEITSLSQIPEWNFDGSSTGQAGGNDSEVFLTPIKLYRDPFRLNNNFLVLCEATNPDGSPSISNFRALSRTILDNCAHEEPWYGMEQEYTLFQTDTYPKWPLGFPEGGYPEEQGPYYCSNGSDYVFGRQVMEAHMRCCIYCGINISGTNAEVMPGQWEYQVGPVEGLDAADQLWMSRYLLLRVAEHYGVGVSFDCKPMAGWNGAGLHTNYSTKSTRANGGLGVIHNYIQNLGENHTQMIHVAGKGNQKRLSGAYETASYKVFSYGVANRGASIRIPRFTDRDGKGYLEDRRPASNCDPYVVNAMIADITINAGANVDMLYTTYTAFIDREE